MVLLLLVSAVPCYLMAHATSYAELSICAGLAGLAGNSFTVGIAWCSAWFPERSKGFALGVFGAGNVGASGTKLLVILIPSVLTLVPAAGLLGGVIPGGWRVVPVFYSVLLLVMAAAILVGCPRVDRKPGKGRRAGRDAGPPEVRPRLAVQPVLRGRVRGLRRPVGLAAGLLPDQLLPRPAPEGGRPDGRPADRPVHLPGQPAPAARRLPVRPVRPAAGHLQHVPAHDRGDRAAVPAGDACCR